MKEKEPLFTIHVPEHFKEIYDIVNNVTRMCVVTGYKVFATHHEVKGENSGKIHEHDNDTWIVAVPVSRPATKAELDLNIRSRSSYF